jgi:Phytanoyl-CoA dioxygenase (PhyH)
VTGSHSQGARMRSDHHDEFRRTGLVRLPGAIPMADAEAMVDRIWDHLDRHHRVVRDQPETWTIDNPGGLRAITAAPEFKALGSAAIRTALDDLLGAGRWLPPRRWGRLLVTFPSVAAEWDLPRGAAWHNDFVPLRQDAGMRAVQLFMILKDLPARGGGTLVLTGSHQLIARYIAESGKPPHPRQLRHALGEHPWLRDLWQPSRYSSAEQRIRRFMTDGTRVDDVELRVVELTGPAGDAFVMHCDTFHAVAPNCHDEPRLMATNLVPRT